MHTKGLTAFALLIMALSTACLSPLSEGPEPPPHLIRAADIHIVRATGGGDGTADFDYPQDLHSYSAVHSLYAGLILPLELAEEMSLPAKYRLIRAVWAGNNSRIEVDGYFEAQNDRLLIETGFRAEDPPLFEWRSNAIYSPLTEGPLRGRGEFLEPAAKPGAGDETASIANVAGTIILVDGRAVRLRELYSKTRAEQLEAEGAWLHLAHLYLHDGQIENDHLIQPLLDECARAGIASSDQAAALLLSQTQYDLYRANYRAALQRLTALKKRAGELSPPVRRLLRFTYEEYCLSRSLDSQNTAYLVEYKQFSQRE